MITSSDISFLYSGGTTNSIPDLSLGGEASVNSLRDGLNGLFRDVTEEQAESGFVDYRCFYMFNDSLIDTFSSVTVAMTEKLDMSIGFISATDVQLLTIEGAVTGGTLTLNYEGEDFTFDYNANIDTWASNMRSAMNGLTVLSGVSVSGSESGTTYSFTVTFGGADDNRSHLLLELVSNNLVGSPSISIAKLAEGGPINLLAREIAVATVPPYQVNFSQPITSPIEIGNFKPGDGASLWIKREILAGTTPVTDEQVTFQFEGT